MKQNRYMADRRRTVVLAALLTGLGSLLAISVYLSSTARAASYLVTEVNGVYQVDGDTVVYPVTLYDADGWTATEVAVDGSTYQDAAGRYYTPSGGGNVTITIYRDGYYLPQAYDADVEYLTAAAYGAGGTTLTYTNPRSEPNFFYIAPPTLEAVDAPDANGAVMTADYTWYYRTADNLTFAPMRYMAIEGAPDGSGLASEQVYGLVAVDGPHFRGAFIPGRSITLTVGGGYAFDEAAPIDTEQTIPDTITATWVNVAAITLDMSGAGEADYAEVYLNIREAVTVAGASGAGYTLTCMAGAAPGTTESIRLLLTVDAGYSQSVPVVTPPEGWVINDGDMGSETAPDGSVRWYITMVYGGGVVPDAPAELTVSVSGVTANPIPGGGGGGGGGGGEATPPSPEPTIRVENELDEENASSDTSLWPYGTTEENGVSATTVTDEELEALLELARQHAEDIGQLPGDGYKEGIIVIEDLSEGSANHTYILELTDLQFQRISDEQWDRFTVQTPAGSFSLYGESIRETAGREGTVSFTLARLEHEGRPGVDVTLEVDHKAVTEFTETYGLRIFVPYTPAEGEDVNAVLMEYIHEDGTVERVTESFYDAAAGGVYVFAGHLSKFGVAYRPAVFSDVNADHWANPYVTFLAARGLLDGQSTFRPDEKATRGELLELLAEALSAANLPSRAVQVYSDVPASSTAAKAAAWAYFNNLAADIINGRQFRPNTAITREDMAALMGDVAAGVGLRVRSKGLSTGYLDLNEVASYARDAVVKFRAAGVLTMGETYRFYPEETLTRGEMAQIIATLLSNL